jgi:hypothetical protein
MTNGHEYRKEDGLDRDGRRVARDIDQMAANLPFGAGPVLRWLGRGSSRWLRIPVALLLIAGGIFGFLPILGFWMLPLGALLLALDIAVLRRPIHWAIARVKRISDGWSRQDPTGSGSDRGNSTPAGTGDRRSNGSDMNVSRSISASGS